MNLVELASHFFAHVQALLRNDAQASIFEFLDDRAGDVLFGRVRFDDGSVRSTAMGSAPIMKKRAYSALNSGSRGDYHALQH